MLLHVCSVRCQNVGKHSPVIFPSLILSLFLRKGNRAHLSEHSFVLVIVLGIQNFCLTERWCKESLSIIQGSRRIDSDVISEIISVTIYQLLKRRLALKPTKYFCCHL